MNKAKEKAIEKMTGHLEAELRNVCYAIRAGARQINQIAENQKVLKKQRAYLSELINNVKK